jgi:hypothetical protein
MTALAAELMVTFEKWTRHQLPLSAAKKAYKGGLAMGRPSTASVVPATTGAGAAGANDIVLGIFAETIDNTANTATTALVNVDFLNERTILWRANDGSITSANLFSKCYAVDDQTVSATSTNRAEAGTILAVDTILGVGFATIGLP